MPVTFRILPDLGLVYVRYEGFALVAESLAAFADYARHPQCRPGQKQLIDLSGITGFEKNFVQLLKLQAKKAEVFTGHGAQTLIVYYAPDPEAFAMARLIERSWEPFPAVIALVQDNEPGALSILGLPGQTFADLLQHDA